MRIYGVLYEGGFAIVPCEALVTIFINESNSEAWEFSSFEDAYVRLCKIYVKREYWTSGVQIVLPPLEILQEHPCFHKAHFVSQPVGYRVWAAMHREFVGIFTSPVYAGQFCERYPFSHVKEFETIEEAQKWLNFCFLKYVLPMSAYIQDHKPYYASIPLDTVMQVRFIEWMAQNCNIPKSLNFPSLPAIPERRNG